MVLSCDVAVGLETVGIFRRAAGKSRVGVLRGLMETNPSKWSGGCKLVEQEIELSLPPSLPPAHADFEGYSVYDIADLVKQFFRELPEPLLTGRLSELLTSVQDGQFQ